MKRFRVFRANWPATICSLINPATFFFGAMTCRCPSLFQPVWPALLG
ncbi:hypothetical protein ABLO16_21705 [Mycobacterium tuberculosis]